MTARSRFRVAFDLYMVFQFENLTNSLRHPENENRPIPIIHRRRSFHRTLTLPLSIRFWVLIAMGCVAYIGVASAVEWSVLFSAQKTVGTAFPGHRFQIFAMRGSRVRDSQVRGATEVMDAIVTGSKDTLEAALCEAERHGHQNVQLVSQPIFASSIGARRTKFIDEYVASWTCLVSIFTTSSG